MLVKAKCVTRAWDSNSCTMFEPGAGPLPEGLYEIDRNGPLASLKLGSNYVFAFDRNGTRTDDGVDVVKDYSCKKCGKKFKNLASLGLHSTQEHKGDDLIPDDEELDLSDRTCTICVPPKVLKTPYGLRLHDMKSHPFTPIEKAAEPETVSV